MSATLRRSLLLVVALFAAVLGPVGAAPATAAGCTTTCSVAPGVQLADVAFPTPERGWIVGAGGYLASTRDGGLTWQRQASGVTVDLRAVDFGDALHGVVVGANEIVLRTTDGGATWVRDAAGFGADLRDVELVDASRGWLAGSETRAPYGNFVATTDDGGLTWQRQQAPGGLGLTEVSFADPLHGFAHGPVDPAYRTADGGATWQQMNVTTSIQYLYAMRRLSATVGVAGGGYGEVLRTTDSGLTWSKVTSLGRPIRAISALGSTVIAVGEGGVAAVSIDDGATWTEAGTATTASFYGVTMASPSLAVAVGQSGFVARVPVGAGQLPPPVELSLRDHYVDCDGVGLTRWNRAAGGPNHATVGDLDGSGRPAVVLSSFGGVRALRPFTEGAAATMWSLDLAARVQKTALAELDGDAGREVVAVTAVAPDDVQGVLALEGATGALLWSSRIAGGASSLAVSDLDGDGADEVVVGGLGATLYVLDGRTGRQLRPSRGIGRVITDIAVADITGDGRADVVVTDEGGGTTAVDGPTGTKLWEHGLGISGLAVATADLNGDGAADVVVGGSGVRQSRFNGTADNRFVVGSSSGTLVVALDGRTGKRIWDYGQSTSGAFGALVTGDFNGDGTPDVAAHGFRPDAGYLVALDGRGDQSSPLNAGEPLELWKLGTTWKDSLTSQAVFGPDGLTVHDGNGDGTPDVYAGLQNGQLMAVSGTVPPRVGVNSAAGTATLLWTERRDVALRAVPLLTGTDRTYVLGLSSDGLVAARDAATGAAAWSHDAGGPMIPLVADGDGDAVDDLVTGSTAGRVTSYRRDGRPTDAPDAFLPQSVVGMASLDIDGDGLLEAVAADREGTVAAYDTRTGGLLWTSTVGAPTTSVAAGAGTVAVGTRTGHVVGLDAATGATRWTTAVASPGTVRHVAFAAGPDVFAAGTANGQLAVLTTAGSAVTSKAMPGLVDGVAGVDVDGDGADELVVAAGTTLTALRANGQQIWSFSGTSDIYQLAAADLTGDGVDDVIAGGRGSTSAVDGRTGAQLFTRSVLLSAGVAGIDLEGDGPAEAVVTSTDKDTYTQLSVVAANGQLRAACVFDTAVGNVASGDFDGDGHSEVAVTTIDGDIYLLKPVAPRPSRTKPPAEVATALAFTSASATQGQYSDTVTLAARLVEVDGTPVVGALVDLDLTSGGASRSFRATTDDTGLALRQVMLVDLPGSYTLSARFTRVPDRYGASSVEAPFTIAREDTLLTLSLQGRNGHRELVAVLRDEDNVDGVLAGRTVQFSAEGVDVGSAVTDAAGVARLTPPARFQNGKRTYGAGFGGDDRYLPASDTRQS